MKISANTAAEISYKIHTNNIRGELMEFADEKNPKLLIFGNKSVIPGLEIHMDGLEENDSFKFTLKPEESFGIYRNELLVDVPKSSFEINGIIKEDLLYLGNEISMMDNAGNTVLGRIIEINKESVKMDFNHKLADTSLYVAGTVHKVRKVTESDLAQTTGCGSGCGCSSNDENKTESCCSSNNEHNHDNEEDCPTCGNHAELRGKGHGNCGCS